MPQGFHLCSILLLIFLCYLREAIKPSKKSVKKSVSVHNYRKQFQVGCGRYLQFLEGGLPGSRPLGARRQPRLAEARPHGLQPAAVLRVRRRVRTAPASVAGTQPTHHHPNYVCSIYASCNETGTPATNEPSKRTKPDVMLTSIDKLDKKMSKELTHAST